VNRTLARHRRGLLVVAAATAATVLTAGTAHADLSDDELQATTDKYLFEISLNEFLDVRDQQPYPDQLDWASDGCSWSPDQPLGYDFSSSCHRHDFGYRNYKKQSRFTEDSRLKIDDNFKSDMYSTCGDEAACKGAANVYYWAVREYGDMSESAAEAVGKARITRETTATGEVAEFRATDRDGRPVKFSATR
jgi:hypothetical protein